jgi:hypothetical protein
VIASAEVCDFLHSDVLKEADDIRGTEREMVFAVR